jgi:hypothetical protein
MAWFELTYVNSTRIRFMNGSFTSDSAASEARKRGSGGGSPRKHDGLHLRLLASRVLNWTHDGQGFS